MNEFADLKPCIILSLGRCGSNLLCNTIGRTIGAVPTTWFVKDPTELASEPVTLSPVHAHNMFPQAATKNYTRIINLRRDSRETILSFVLGLHYDYFHQTTESAKENFKPFEFTDWAWLLDFCKYYVRWHNFYSYRLCDKDFVVIYEDLVSAVDQSSVRFLPTYTNKQSLLLNYDQVCAAIDQHVPEMNASSAKLLNHVNPVDLYSWFNVQQ